MTLSLLTSFWLISFLFIISPGMDWAYAISAGTTKRYVLPAVSGMVVGHLLIILLIAGGMGSLIQKFPLSLPIITSLGALYLLWQGISRLRTPANPLDTLTSTSYSPIQWFRKGITISLLNPKVIMLIIAILPQFIHPQSSWGVPLQITVLGGIHYATCLVIYLTVGYGMQYLLSIYPQATNYVNYLSGFAMASIGLLLLVDFFTKQLTHYVNI